MSDSLSSRSAADDVPAPSRESAIDPGYCKFTQYIDDEPREYRYPNVWAAQNAKGVERLIIAPAASHVELTLELTEPLPEPFYILYVLMVPRSDDEPGRYQSPIIGRGDMIRFMRDFRHLFEYDGRHHIWISSLCEDHSSFATLVYDRHNVIYSYGPLHQFERILVANGLQKTDEVRIPDPHGHYYNHELDDEALRLLDYWEWHISPLQSADT